MKEYNISLLAGDGTGPEVVNEAVKSSTKKLKQIMELILTLL